LTYQTIRFDNYWFSSPSGVTLTSTSSSSAEVDFIKVGPAVTSYKTTYSQLGKLALEEHIDALICSNATPDPNGLSGGWCGRALKAPSIAALWELQQVTSRKIPIVSVGGILTGTDVAARLQAGASAVQIASALLLRGRNAASLLHREHELLASTTTH
jgi:dihydroorotate dehydrogenase